MATIDVDSDIFEDDELIEALGYRLDSSWKPEAQKNQIRKKLAELLNIAPEKPSKISLMDSQKIEYFMANMDNISQEQLEMIVEHKLAVA
jgi:benzoyl-CoA reductase/2-hydroxyglutaryl-CoA dehydratase subunit BcrC/BadD/HgdB